MGACLKKPTKVRFMSNFIMAKSFLSLNDEQRELIIEHLPPSYNNDIDFIMDSYQSVVEYVELLEPVYHSLTILEVTNRSNFGKSIS